MVDKQKSYFIFPDSMPKQQFGKFIEDYAKKIDKYEDQSKSGYIVTFKKPALFPSNRKYDKVFIGDQVDYRGMMYVDGLSRNQINKNNDTLIVVGFESSNPFMEKYAIQRFFDNIDTNILLNRLKQREEQRKEDEEYGIHPKNVIHCVCGGHYINTVGDRKEHEKTQKHRKYFHKH